MPRTSKPPAYRLHKASEQAIVTINGKDHYLGLYGSEASRTAYATLIAGQATTGKEARAAVPAATGDITCAELFSAFLTHADSFYRDAHGKPNGDHGNYRTLLKRLRRFTGREMRVSEFGPNRLRAFRDTLVEEKLARTNINQTMGRVRTIFKWGVGRELVAPSVLHALQAVEALRYGKTEAKETDPVRPVPDAWVDGVLPYCPPQIKAMIELQRVTGMRSGEVCIMRTCDINTSGKVWTYTPSYHKTAYRGHQRVVYLGPQAQAILKPWLRANLADFLFSPKEVEADRRAAQRAARKTPLSCGNSTGTNRAAQPRKQPGDRYDSGSYKGAVDYAIGRCNKDRIKRGEPEIRWHPHQLRHNAATRLRKEFGLEVARVVLGHKTAAITEVYAEADQARAADAMLRCG